MFFQSFFFASGGANMYYYGSYIRLRWELDQEETLHKDEYEIIITFVGTGIAMLLYVSHLFEDIKYFHKFVLLFAVDITDVLALLP